jgi:Tol biopolymer transport system component
VGAVPAGRRGQCDRRRGGGVFRSPAGGGPGGADGPSPDGTQIVFEHRSSIFTVHPDGTGLAKVPLATSSRSFAGDISWSPDGKKIAFILSIPTGAPAGGSQGSFQEGIATANADGSDVQQLTNSPTFDHQPDWGALPPTG